jgi:cyclohexyl-isocyanide hydratase
VDRAQAIQLGSEYDPAPPFDSGSPEKTPPEIMEMVKRAYAAKGR